MNRLWFGRWALVALLAGPASGQALFLPDIPYAVVPVAGGGTRTLFVDLYLPQPASGPVPCVISIHGGSWRGGRRFPTRADILANHGIAVASIDYRLSQEAIWPAQIHDCKGAVRWLRANASTYGLDPDRIGAWGASAGGHLAACLATMGGVGAVRIGSLTIDLEGSTGGNLSHSSRIQAAFDWFGPTDLLRMSAFPSAIDHDAPNSGESQLVGAALPLVPELVASADPVHFLSADDATIAIQHGTIDDTVPFDQSERLYRAARDGFGLPYEFTPRINIGHGSTGFDLQDLVTFFTAQFQALPELRVSLSASAVSLAEAGGAVTLTVSRAQADPQPLRVPLAVQGGDAVPGQDLLGLPEFLVIPAFGTTATAVLTAVDDALVEGTEVLRIAIPARPGHRVAADAASLELSIQDDDADPGLPEVRLVLVDGTMGEPSDPALVRLERTDATGELFVALRARGTARPGVDFAGFGPSVHFPIGVSSIDVILTPIDDAIFENTEFASFELLAGPDYRRAADREVSVQILDDEAQASGPRLSISTSALPLREGGVAGHWIFGRRGGPAGALTVPISVSGRATVGADVPALAQNVVFPSGVNIVRWPMTATTDGLAETDEDLRISLGSPAGAVPTTAQSAAHRIEDKDRLRESLNFEVTPLVLGREAVIGIQSDPLAFIAVAAALAPGYSDFGAFPLLLDPASAAVVAMGSTDALGSYRQAILLADEPALVGTDVLLQALSFGASVPFVWSGAIVRRIVF